MPLRTATPEPKDAGGTKPEQEPCPWIMGTGRRKRRVRVVLQCGTGHACDRVSTRSSTRCRAAGLPGSGDSVRARPALLSERTHPTAAFCASKRVEPMRRNEEKKP